MTRRARDWRWRPRRAGQAAFPETGDRRTLRRLAALVCLGLAAYCLVAAYATLDAQTIPGQPDPQKLASAPRHPWPLLIPILFLGFVVIAALILHDRRRRRVLSGPRTRAGRPPAAPAPPGQPS
ncbi:MAG: hypothetical protein ACRELA_18330 [Candidatus Rokuibacteriota bacterium]